MGFKEFLTSLLAGGKSPDRTGPTVTVPSPDVHDPYAVRINELHRAFATWQKTKVLNPAQLMAIGTEPILASLDNRSGYVREFCLRALGLLEASDSLKPVLQRLNDYVPGNRDRALQLVLKWGAEIPLAGLVDALPEIDALKSQSRTDHSAVDAALAQRLDSAEGHEALVAGLVHTRAMVRRGCWTRCTQALEWNSAQRIAYAMGCGDPGIARSVEGDVFALPDSELVQWFSKLRQVRAMPLRRAFLVALRRKNLVDTLTLIDYALWDDSFSIRWHARHWGKDVQEHLLNQYVAVLQGKASMRNKRYALEGLAQLKSPVALQASHRAFGDADALIRKAALAVVCALDTDHQTTYLGQAMLDADMVVVREAFRLLGALGAPLPLEAIATAAQARQGDPSFFDALLRCASTLSFWPALHLASFTSLATDELRIVLSPAIAKLSGAQAIAEVYVAPTKLQWQAITAWKPIHTMHPNSGIRLVMEIYAKKMAG